MTKTLVTIAGTDSILNTRNDSILIPFTLDFTAEDFESAEDLIDFLHDDEHTILFVDESIAHLL